jgi:hypothetical protein
MGNPVAVFVFLANSDGQSFRISLKQVERYPDLDLAFIRIPKRKGSQLQPNICPGLTSSGKVYNIGFPDRAQRNIHYNVDLKHLAVKFDKGPWMQSGEISSSCSLTSNCNDVNLVDATCLILGYASENGFSGGPLFLRKDNCVMGMMLMVLPTKDRSPPTKSVALSAHEIIGALE